MGEPPQTSRLFVQEVDNFRIVEFDHFAQRKDERIPYVRVTQE